MFTVPKGTAVGAIKRLGGRRRRQPHALVRLLDSRSAFEKSTCCVENHGAGSAAAGGRATTLNQQKHHWMMSATGSSSSSSSSSNDGCSSVLSAPPSSSSLLQQKSHHEEKFVDNSSSMTITNTTISSGKNNHHLQTLLKEGNIANRVVSSMIPFQDEAATTTTTTTTTVIRDASLRAINDASIRFLKSALISSSSSFSSNHQNNIFIQSIIGGNNTYTQQPRRGVVYYSTSSSNNNNDGGGGPVNKGGKYSTSVKVPTPKSSSSSSSSTTTSLNPFSGSFDPKELTKKVMEVSWSLTKTLLSFLIRLPYNTLYYATHSKARKDKIAEIKEIAKKEFDHYWTGTKLLMADIRTARNLTAQALEGSSLTRRERKQLLRTVSDLFRLIPFSMFMIIPFMEFVLPFALRIFPNLLPSTFQDSLKEEEKMKRELKSRIAMAQFFQDTLEELAKEQKRIASKRTSETPDNKIAEKQEESAESMLEFLDHARNGEMMSTDVIIQYAKYFQDDLTLDNMPRMQLINMCKYMSIPPYGNDSFLRFQLRHRIRNLQEDDQRILWEGIESLTKMELREACQERGMRSTGLSKEAYKRSLQQWLDLSVHKNIPISLLIMSRIFFLRDDMTAVPAVGEDDELKSVAGLADAISGLDKEVVNQVVLEVATSEEKKSNLDVRKIKLEVLTSQNEKIKEEQAEREAAAKKKESSSSSSSAASQDKPDEELIAVELEVEIPTTSDKPVTVDSVKVGTVKTKKDKVSGVDGADATAAGATLDDEPATESKGSDEDKSDSELSAADFEAIEQLLTADPVSKEREELEKIKSAIQEGEIGPEGVEDIKRAIVDSDSTTDRKESIAEALDLNMSGDADKRKEDLQSMIDSPDEYAANRINQMEESAKEEADKATTFTTASELPPDIDAQPAEVKAEHIDVVENADDVEPEDPIVARLKKRVESMVDKIEVQLSDVQVKIGDKLHFLDKDMDGILSPEEMAEVLHQVLKRNISMEEALEISNQIDENKDGKFTVQELIHWIETNKLVKLESEGRDADMDRVIESQSTESQTTSPSPVDNKNQNSKSTVE